MSGRPGRREGSGRPSSRGTWREKMKGGAVGEVFDNGDAESYGESYGGGVEENPQLAY